MHFAALNFFKIYKIKSFAFLCTILNLNILQFFVKILLIFAEILQIILQESTKIRNFEQKTVNFEIGALQI